MKKPWPPDRVNGGRYPTVLQLGKFYPPHRGGMESHLKTLCDQLAIEFRVKVLVSNAEPRTINEIVNGIPVTRLSSLALLASTSVNPAMSGFIRRSGADLVHLHWPNPMAALAYLTSRHPGPLVITYHSDVVKQRFLSQLFAPLLRILLRRACAIIVSSPNYLETSPVLREHHARCRVIPFGIPEQCFAAPDADSVLKIRAEHGDRIILSVGRLVDYKGFAHLIEAMTMVPGRLLIAGDGPLKRKLLRLTQSFGLGDRVVFTGAIPARDLRVFYHAADVFVLASTDRREAFGLAQVEAMAAAKPVINTHLESGVPFVSQNNLTGLTVPPADAAALAAALRRLLDDAALRSRMGQAARRRAEAVFGAAAMKERTVEIYHHVLATGTAPRESECLHAAQGSLVAD